MSHFLQFQRDKTALKYFLIGRGYHLALKALGFVERYHVGLRKDGLTPELHHQIQIALSVTQEKDLIDEELCLVIALLHDVQEDYSIPSEIIEQEFGKRVRDINWKMTKKFAGEIKNKKDLIDAIASDPIASIDKGLDRCNNLNSMIPVFSIDKMESYADEAEDVFLPMLKKAGKLFPEQQAAYHSISEKMKQAIRFTRHYVKAVRERELLIEESKKIIEESKKFVEESTQFVEEAKVYALEMEQRNKDLTAELEQARNIDQKSLNKEAFRKALSAVLLTCQYINLPVREQVLGIKEIADKLRVDFGISELELFEFNSLVTGPIPTP